jgi:hypothetical protein
VRARETRTCQLSPGEAGLLRELGDAHVHWSR